MPNIEHPVRTATRVDHATPIAMDATLFVALELSLSSWVVVASAPGEDKISKHRVDACDGPGLLALLDRLRLRAEQRCGRSVAVVVRTNCRFISASSSSCTMRADAAKPCSARSSPAWSHDQATTPEPNKSLKTKFLGYLREIVRTNNVLVQGELSSEVGAEQVTTSMQDTRSMPLERRVALYIQERVKSQQTWYVSKARGNRRAFKWWVAASVTAYVLAIALALSRIAFPSWHYLPIEPPILFASFVIGWVQIKKHSELAASYTLTATEIGMAKEEAQHIGTEHMFSDYVNDTELVFSREHTQWVARQKTAG